jgi:hypothetical protein
MQFVLGKPMAFSCENVFIRWLLNEGQQNNHLRGGRVSVSVIGLVDPPYQGRHFGRSYTHVWITIIDGGQINFLEDNEDRYRRGCGKLGTGDATNQRILSSIRGSSAGASIPSAYLPSLQTLAFSRN